MKQLVEFPLQDGTSVLIEVEDPLAASGVVRAAKPGEVAARAKQTLEDALDQIKPAATAVIKKLRSTAKKPG